jgi:hypothetical protein
MQTATTESKTPIAREGHLHRRSLYPDRRPLGSETLLYVDLAGTEVIASGPGVNAPQPGARIGLQPDTLHIFDASTGYAIR